MFIAKSKVSVQKKTKRKKKKKPIFFIILLNHGEGKTQSNKKKSSVGWNPGRREGQMDCTQIFRERTVILHGIIMVDIGQHTFFQELQSTSMGPDVKHSLQLIMTCHISSAIAMKAPVQGVNNKGCVGGKDSRGVITGTQCSLLNFSVNTELFSINRKTENTVCLLNSTGN